MRSIKALAVLAVILSGCAIVLGLICLRIAIHNPDRIVRETTIRKLGTATRDVSLITNVANVREFAEIKTTSLQTGTLAHLDGYREAADGGGGTFYFDAESAQPPDGGTVVAPNDGHGRWRRVLDGAFNVRWFGAKGDGVADDSGAIGAAYAALVKGVLYFPRGTYLTSRFLTPKDSVRISGDGRTASKIVYTGGTAWILQGHADVVSDFGLEDLTIDASRASRAIRIGDTAGVAGNMRDRWSFRRLLILGPASKTAGSIGVSLTNVGNSRFDEVNVEGFETPLINDRTTVNVWTRLRCNQGLHGAKWVGRAPGAMNDWVFGFDCGFGYSGGNGVGLLIDGLGVRIFGAFYEVPAGKSGKCFWEVTANGGDFEQHDAFYSLSGSGKLANTFIIGANWSGDIRECGGTIVAAGFPAPAVGAPSGNFNADFIDCSLQYNAIVAPAATDKIRVSGAGVSALVGPTTYQIGANNINPALFILGQPSATAGGRLKMYTSDIPVHPDNESIILSVNSLSGKVRLLATFPSGESQVIATER